MSEEFAEFAWMKLEILNSRINLTLPNRTVPGRIHGVQGRGVNASSIFEDGALRINLEKLTADSRRETEPAGITVRFNVEPENPVAGQSYIVESESISFDFALTIGVGDEEGPLVGGVSGRMTGRGAENLAETTVKDSLKGRCN